MKKSYAEKRRLAGFLFVLPSLAGVCVFFLLPFANVIKISLTRLNGEQFCGLENYGAVLTNKAFLLAAGNTLKFIAVCIPLLLVISFLLSVLLSGIPKAGEALKSAYLIPLAVPVASAAMLWKIFFNDNGIINSLLVSAGIEPVSWMSGGAAFLVLAGSYLWKNIGYDIILWLAGLSEIPKSVTEAAELDGCVGVKRIIYIILPQLKGTIFTVLVLSLINSFRVFREIYLVAGDYPDESIYMLQNFFNNRFAVLDTEKMSAGAVVTAIGIAAAVIGIKRLFAHFGEEEKL